MANNPSPAIPTRPLAEVIEELCIMVFQLWRHFYTKGWITSSGGGLTVKIPYGSIPKSRQHIIVSPSGFFLAAKDLYVLTANGDMFIKPTSHEAPVCTGFPIFMKAYEMCGAGAVIHSHAIKSCIVTMMNPSAKEFKITHMEMIKGIKGHRYNDELVVPIIENELQVSKLTVSFVEAIKAYPKTTAVLVRNHGIFVWADTWTSARTQAECYHYLFGAAIRLNQMGIDWTSPDHGFLNIPRAFQQTPVTGGLKTDNYAMELSRKCIVLDIDGTTTPASFVTEKLFPYACDNVRKHLISTYDTKETKADIELLRVQVEKDCKNGISGAVPIPAECSGKDSVIDSIVTNVEAMIKAGRKITSLNQLQSHIWTTGFESKELQVIVFEDVPIALKKWHSEGKKVYIYSNRKREAQRLLFANTTYGDLRRYLCGFFDKKVGDKKQKLSYLEIARSLGVDNESQILFVTNVYQEAVAAKTAGFEVLISIRPGNAPITSDHGFKTITSFAEI